MDNIYKVPSTGKGNKNYGIILGNFKSVLPIFFLFTIIIATGFYSLTVLSAQNHPGPQTLEKYISWEPGDGRSGDDCIFGSVNINQLLDYNGAIVTGACSEVLSGEFWTIVTLDIYPESILLGEIIPELESGYPVFWRFVVDPNTPAEKIYQFHLAETAERNPDGTVKIRPVTDLFPDINGSIKKDSMVVYTAYMGPENVGDHLVEVYFIDEPLNDERFLGTFSFSVVSQ